MSRPAIRTEQIHPKLQKQLKELYAAECLSAATFHRRYLLETMSYPTFYNAVSGFPATDETLQAIDAALDEVYRQQIRRDRTHCTYCKNPLD